MKRSNFFLSIIHRSKTAAIVVSPKWKWCIVKKRRANKIRLKCQDIAWPVKINVKTFKPFLLLNSIFFVSLIFLELITIYCFCCCDRNNRIQFYCVNIIMIDYFWSSFLSLPEWYHDQLYLFRKVFNIEIYLKSKWVEDNWSEKTKVGSDTIKFNVSFYHKTIVKWVNKIF